MNASPKLKFCLEAERTALMLERWASEVTNFMLIKGSTSSRNPHAASMPRRLCKRAKSSVTTKRVKSLYSPLTPPRKLLEAAGSLETRRTQRETLSEAGGENILLHIISMLRASPGRLEVRSKVHLLITQIKFSSDVVSMGIDRAGRYPDDFCYLLGFPALLYEREYLCFSGA
jgi:hypothetical protein